MVDFDVSNPSKKLELNKEDGQKILKGLGIAIGGAALTFLTEIIPNVDWGEFTPAIVALSSVLINAGWKWIQGKK